MTLLDIKNLHVSVAGKKIFNGLDLKIEPGTVHVIMGPNGSGKSTLSNVIVGNPVYEVTDGEMTFKGKNLREMTPDVRANEGIFMAFQNPVEIDGVSYASFLKQAMNAKRAYYGEPPLDAMHYLKHIKMRAEALNVTNDMLKRPLNVGFSGGEKKRMETMQMAVLEPDLCILDELDSGLDVDALKEVATGVNLMREEHRSFLLITHNPRLLDYVMPDRVHILVDGQIVKTGGRELVDEISRNGFKEFKHDAE